jgi:hypothetical protein
MSVYLWLPLQPVDATQAANRSAGASNPNVWRGRSLRHGTKEVLLES